MKIKNIFCLAATALLLGAGSMLTGCSDDSDFAPYIEASESDIELEPDGYLKSGQPATVELGANQSWKIVSKPEWVVVNHESGDAGRAYLWITAQPNKSGEDRTGYVEFRLANGRPEQLSITQKREPDVFRVSESTFAVNILGKTDKDAAPEVTITSNYAWEIVLPEGCNWIEPSKAKGEAGESAVALNVLPNDTKATRKAQLHVKSGKSEKLITITQDVKVFTIPVTSITINLQGTHTADGQQLMAPIQAVEPWKVTEKPEWLKVTPDHGAAGQTVVTLAADENTDAERAGKLTLTSDHGIEYTLNIYQEGVVKDTPDSNPVGHVYFYDTMDWAIGGIDAMSEKKAGDARNIYTWKYADNGFTNPLPTFQSLYFDFNAASETVYTMAGYLKMNRGATQTAIMIKEPLIETGHYADIEIEFDYSHHQTDKMEIACWITDKDVTDQSVLQEVLASPTFKSEKTTGSETPWVWKHASIKYSGANANTKIIFGSAIQGNQSGYYRWYIDNIKVTRTETK